MASPRTILYIDNTSTFGGAINSLGELVAGLDRDRYSPVVVTAQPRELLDERFPGVRIRRLEPRLPWIHDRLRRRLTRLPGLRSGPGRKIVDLAHAAYWLPRHTWPEARRYARIAREEGAALLHLNNNLESQESALLASGVAGLPSIVHARSFQMPRRSVRRLAERADRHVAISTAIRDNLVEVGVEPDRIGVIHDGIDPQAFSVTPEEALRARRELGLSPGDPAIGIFGRIVRWKGIAEFVSAARGILVAHPSARAFVVGGRSDGAASYYHRIEEAVRTPELEGRLVLTGYRPDVRATMAAMDVVVHASVDPEPFGMVLIEAMALGKPVVATRGGGPEDIVIPGETGLLVDRGDVQGLREAIEDLLSNPDGAKAMGAAGRDRVAREFSRERYAGRTMRLYDEILGERDEAPRP